jgi:hypothetical protein
MPVTPTYPGIYIQELPSSVHTITAAPTNIAVFIGYTHPLKTLPANWNKAVQIFGFQDYQRQFGGFLRSTTFAGARNPSTISPDVSFGDMAQAVNQFFLNGGTEAYVVGLPVESQFLGGAVTPGIQGATWQIGPLTFTALEITDATYQMIITIRPVQSAGASPPPSETADITIVYGPQLQSGVPGPGTVTETYRSVSLIQYLDQAQTMPNPNYIVTRIGGSIQTAISSLVIVTVAPGSPPGSFLATTTSKQLAVSPSGNISPASLFNALDFTNVMQQDTDLDKLAIFNLMVIPGVTNELVLSTALAFCENKRAFFIMDPPINASADGTFPSFQIKIQDVISSTAMPKGTNGALYFPYLESPDPITGLSTDPTTNIAFEIPPSPSVCGIFAATDLSRGVWKAPAGLQATTTNTTGVVDRGRMTDQRQGVLNPLGVNSLRDFPNVGTAVFGARTLVTVTNEQWRYVPVRRMALFLEQTLYSNLGWVVFEPNAEPLWVAIRSSIQSFMLGLFRQGAFQGTTPSEAFQVKCDDQTTTQDDINNGIVNIVVAFAPLKPAEFVIIQIAQLAGQTQTS